MTNKPEKINGRTTGGRMKSSELVVCIACFSMLLITVPAVSAAENGTVCEQGAIIFIGEEGLNVTHAMNQAYYRGSASVGNPLQNNSPLELTRIGWWASAAHLYNTSPSKVIDLGVNGRYRMMTVAPADFVGYTGNWYLLEANGARPVGVSGEAAMVFTVQDPSLDIKIWDYNQNTDVTGKSVPQGDCSVSALTPTCIPPLIGGTAAM